MIVNDALSSNCPASQRIVVLGMLERLDDSRRIAFWEAIAGAPAPALQRTSAGAARRRPGTTVGATPRRRPVASLARLATGRADIVVAEDFGWLALAAGLSRSWFRTMSFFVLLTEPPARLRILDRLILRLADGVLVDGDATARVVSQPAFPARSVCRIVPRYPAGPARDVPRRVASDSTRRIVIASPLSAQSGTPDVLTSVASWAEAHPERMIELTWVGEGDLAGVLAAQPLPSNLSQSFPGALGPDEAADAFARAELLVVPGLADDETSHVVMGFASGLPVLGSRRRRDVRLLVTEGLTGWLFDPAKPGDFLEAFDRALDLPIDALQTMRARARDALAQDALHGAAPGRLPVRRASAAPAASVPKATLRAVAERVR